MVYKIQLTSPTINSKSKLKNSPKQIRQEQYKTVYQSDVHDKW